MAQVGSEVASRRRTLLIAEGSMVPSSPARRSTLPARRACPGAASSSASASGSCPRSTAPWAWSSPTGVRGWTSTSRRCGCSGRRRSRRTTASSSHSTRCGATQPAPRHGAHRCRWDVIGGHPRGPSAYGDGYFPYVGPQHDFVPELRRILADVDAECDRVGRDSTRSRSQSAAPAPPRRRRPWPNSASTAARSPSASKEMPEVRDELDRFGTEVIEPTKEL